MSEEIDQFLNSLKLKSDSTVDTYRYAIKRLQGHTEPDLEDLSKQDIIDWMIQMRDEEDLNPSSINQYLMSVQQFYTHLSENIPIGVGEDELRRALERRREYGKIINIERIEEERKERKPLNEDSIISLLEAAEEKPHHKRMITLYLYFGFRKTELLKLQRKNVDYNNRTVKVSRETTKNPHGVREVPYTPEIDDHIDADGKYVVKGDRPYSEGMPNMMCRRYDNLVDGKLYPHRFRITFNTFMKEAGVDDFVLKKLMGHTTEQDMTDYYHGESEKLVEDKRKAMTEEHYLLPLLEEGSKDE